MISVLMKILAFIFLVYVFFSSSCQKVSDQKFETYYVDELMEKWKYSGFDLIEPVDPTYLYYFDTSYVKDIINFELLHESDLINPHPDSNGIFRQNVPKLTFKFLENRSEYAAKKLYEFYQKTPKFITSDTIYNIYNILDRLFPLLLNHHLKNIKDDLKKDYDEWKLLLIKSPHKRFITDEEHESRLKNWEIKYPKISETLYPDIKGIMFQIALTLNYLKVSGFGDEIIDSLRRDLPNAFDRKLAKFNNFLINPTVFDSSNLKTFELLNVKDLDLFIHEDSSIQRLLKNIEGTDINFKIDYVVIQRNDKAIVSMSYKSWANKYLIYLINNNKLGVLLIEQIHFQPAPYID